MKILKQLENFKYKCGRIVEGNPLLLNAIYNNISHFKFLFPHEKDYHGIKFFCKDRTNGDFIDIGANIGLSTIGFRKLGFENRIVLFEANPHLAQILRKLEQKYRGLNIQQVALGNENADKEIHLAYYKGVCLHTFSSFNRDFIVESVKKSFPDKHHEVEIRTAKVSVRRFDDLPIEMNPQFIKIDVEGFEQEILKGMKNTIQKFRPVFLIEYNRTNFQQVFDLLSPDYSLFAYNLKSDRVDPVELGNLERLVDPSDPFCIRNLFFVPKDGARV